MTAARRLLGKQGGPPAAGQRPRLQDWVPQYDLVDCAYRVPLRHGSPLVGKRLGEQSLRTAGINLLVIERSSRLAAETIRPTAQTELRANDILFIDAVASVVERRALLETYKIDVLPLGDDRGYLTDAHHDVGMAEAMLPPESLLIGHTVLEPRVRRVQGLTMIGLRRGREILTGELRDEQLQLGDTVLLVDLCADIRRLAVEGGDLVVLNLPFCRHYATRRRPWRHLAWWWP
ncbi:MAG TPA: TrkA C-terminal domain-containing protein [Acetobacteraceae bacterium]|nr:TrkA C-terminal domain-containing protein [Acetobacteraceae bacterium]